MAVSFVQSFIAQCAQLITDDQGLGADGPARLGDRLQHGLAAVVIAHGVLLSASQRSATRPLRRASVVAGWLAAYWA